LEIIFIGEKC